jgi:hypothetical protein
MLCSALAWHFVLCSGVQAGAADVLGDHSQLPDVSDVEVLCAESTGDAYTTTCMWFCAVLCSGVQAGAADVLGEHSRLPGVSDDGERESDDVEDLEDSIPYSEDFDDWPDAPVMLCPDPAAAHQVGCSCLGLG